MTQSNYEKNVKGMIETTRKQFEFETNINKMLKTTKLYYADYDAALGIGATDIVPGALLPEYLKKE